MNVRYLFFILSGLLLTSCATGVQKLTNDHLVKSESVVIPQKLNEISSLEIQADGFSGINDSGGENTVYYFTESTPSNIYKSIELSNTTNVDWESMAESDTQIFVGDFGNNIGNRKDLKVYYIEKDKISSNLNQEITAQEIQFFYPEQEKIKPQAYSHDFDCEAMVYHNKTLHLFSKEWKSENLKHYTLDIIKGKQPAWLIEQFDLGFLATGADIVSLNKKKSRLGIVGYNRDGEVFLLLTDFLNKSNKWLNHPKSIIKIGVASELGQVEGIAFKSANEFYISAEAIDSELGKKKQSITKFIIK